MPRAIQPRQCWRCKGALKLNRGVTKYGTVEARCEKCGRVTYVNVW